MVVALVLLFDEFESLPSESLVLRVWALEGSGGGLWFLSPSRLFSFVFVGGPGCEASPMRIPLAALFGLDTMLDVELPYIDCACEE